MDLFLSFAILREGQSVEGELLVGHQCIHRMLELILVCEKYIAWVLSQLLQLVVPITLPNSQSPLDCILIVDFNSVPAAMNVDAVLFGVGDQVSSVVQHQLS